MVDTQIPTILDFMHKLAMRVWFQMFYSVIKKKNSEQEEHWERERGGWDRERSASRDLNSGRPKRKGATYRLAAHEALSPGNTVLFDNTDKWSNLKNECSFLYCAAL